MRTGVVLGIGSFGERIQVGSGRSICGRQQRIVGAFRNWSRWLLQMSVADI